MLLGSKKGTLKTPEDPKEKNPGGISKSAFFFSRSQSIANHPKNKNARSKAYHQEAKANHQKSQAKTTFCSYFPKKNNRQLVLGSPRWSFDLSTADFGPWPLGILEVHSPKALTTPLFFRFLTFFEVFRPKGLSTPEFQAEKPSGPKVCTP